MLIKLLITVLLGSIAQLSAAETKKPGMLFPQLPRKLLTRSRANQILQAEIWAALTS